MHFRIFGLDHLFLIDLGCFFLFDSERQSRTVNKHTTLEWYFLLNENTRSQVEKKTSLVSLFPARQFSHTTISITQR